MVISWLCFEGVVSAQEAPIRVIEKAQSSEDLSPYIYYLLDPTWELTADDVITQQVDIFAPLQTVEPDFGYIDEKVWLRLVLNNQSPDIAAWRVYVRENFLQYYAVYLLRADGRIETAELHNLNTPFSARKIDFPELVTPINIAPGEQVTLLISYWSGGSSHAAVSLETSYSFARIAMSRTSKNYISYGMMSILIIASLLAIALLRQRVFLAYLTYVFVTLVYLMHADGVAFQYLWPGLPRFNSYFSIVIGTAFVMATYNFARVFLQTQTYHTRIDIILRALFWLTPVLTIAGTIFDPQLTKQSIIAMVFVAITAGALTGMVASFTRFRQVRFYLFAWLCGIICAGLMSLRHNFGFDISQDTEFDSIRISIVVDAIMMGLGVADRYTQMLRSRQKATEQSLTEAKRNLELNSRLFDLEEKYQLATEMVASKDQALQNTVHDLRQPLHALRLNVQRLRSDSRRERETVNAGTIDETFSYLETLITAQLQSSMQLEVEQDAPRVNLWQSEPDTAQLSLSDILRSVQDMFLSDATQKGLELRFVDTRLQTDLDPLVLMRIVTNLVSNAIKYTPSGKVLIGARRRASGLSVEVHDTGPGLSQKDYAVACQRDMRLEQDNASVEGNGLGLAIAHDLAAKYGLALRLDTRRTSGTSFLLIIPYTVNMH